MRYPMKRSLFLLAIILIAALAFMTGCAGSKITVDQAYKSLKPVKQLELPEQIENNLVIIVENVADEGSSYKNRIDLYINDKRIQPNWAVSNVENTYTYKLKVRPGYYKVRAEYFAYVGWGEEKYPIETDDLVRVTHDARTIVRCNIAKEPNGEPVDKTMYFKIKSEPFSSSQVGAPDKVSEILPPAKSRRPVQSPAPAESTAPVKKLPNRDSVVLQINTIPERTKVILDDRMVGHSPLRIVADRKTDHVLQLSAPGYKTSVKFLDKTVFGDEEIVHIVQELEREKE